MLIVTIAPAALGGFALGVWGSRRYWYRRGARAALIDFREMLKK